MRLYLEPAAERAKQFEEERKATAPGGGKPLGKRRVPKSSQPDYEPGTPEHKAQHVAAYMDMMRMSRERAEAAYDRQMAEWKAEQNGHRPD